MEHCIASFSVSTSLREDDLVSILRQSRFYNMMAGITGILLFHDRSIVQVLEGKKEMVKALYERIEKDPRHTDVTKIVDCTIDERSFADWRMDCKSITRHQLEIIRTVVNLENADWLLVKPSTNTIVNMVRSVY